MPIVLLRPARLLRGGIDQFHRHAHTVALDTNATWFGGSGYAGTEGFDTERVAWHGFGDSAVISLPPLAVMWFAGSTES